MANVIVAIACNLVVVLLLASGIFSALHNGVKISLIKFLLTVAGGVGSYFLAPMFSNKIYGVKGVTELFDRIGISVGSVNSCLFLAVFLIFYASTIVACTIIRHIMIKKLRDKKRNALKIKRARSINPRAERALKRAEWKALKAKYKEGTKWYHRVLSGFLGCIIAFLLGYVVLMPYGYIAKDIDGKKDKGYLVKGYEYTVNGLIGDKVSDFIIKNK